MSFEYHTLGQEAVFESFYAPYRHNHHSCYLFHYPNPSKVRQVFHFHFPTPKPRKSLSKLSELSEEFLPVSEQIFQLSYKVKVLKISIFIYIKYFP